METSRFELRAKNIASPLPQDISRLIFSFLQLAIFCTVLIADITLAADRNSSSQSLELNEKGISALRSGDSELAEQLFKQALKTDTGNLSAVFNLAGIYMQDGKMTETIALLKTYTDREHSDTGLIVRLGDAHLALKDVNSALVSYERAYRLQPDYEELTLKLASVYILLNRLAEAERYMQIAVDERPKDAELLANFSSLLIAVKKPADAIEYAKRALQINPSARTYKTLATAHELLGDHSNALIAYRRAQDLEPADKTLEQRIKLLESKSR
jgi:Tfp pilus assembly protein PilF